MAQRGRNKFMANENQLQWQQPGNWFVKMCVRGWKSLVFRRIVGEVHERDRAYEAGPVTGRLFESRRPRVVPPFFHESTGGLAILIRGERADGCGKSQLWTESHGRRARTASSGCRSEQNPFGQTNSLGRRIDSHHARYRFLNGLTPVLVCGIALVAVGCDQFKQAPAEPEIPRLKVNLPDSPSLVVPNVPSRNESGVYTVNGLFKESSTLMNSVVSVSGVVLTRHICDREPVPDVAVAVAGIDAGSQDSEPPAPPDCHPPEHVTLVDDLARTRYQLLVAGNRVFVESVAEGQTVTVKGRLVQWTRDNIFVRSEGLIELEPPPPEPPPAAAVDADAQSL